MVMMSKSRWPFRTALLLTIAACNPLTIGTPGEKDDPDAPPVPDDVTDALKQLPDATVIAWTTDGLPMFIVGEMAKVGSMQTDDMVAAQQALEPALPPILEAVPPGHRGPRGARDERR